MVYHARDGEVPDLSSGNAILVESYVYSCACVSEPTGRGSSRLILPPRPLLERRMAQCRMRWLFASVMLGALLSPVAAVRAQDSTVTCKDGTTGTAGRGACSHHGGVGTPTSTTASTAPAAPAATAPAKTSPAPASSTTATSTTATSTTAAGKSGKSETTDPTGAIAKCKDGLYSHSKTHTGTCSRHGGVAQWLDGTAQ
jgi:hypothetical protein